MLRRATISDAPKTLFRRAAIFLTASLLAATMGFTTGSEAKHPIRDPLLREVLRYRVPNAEARFPPGTLATLEVVAAAIHADKLGPKTINTIMTLIRTDPLITERMIRNFSFRFCTDGVYEPCESLVLLIRDGLFGALGTPQNAASRAQLVSQVRAMNSAADADAARSGAILTAIHDDFAPYLAHLRQHRSKAPLWNERGVQFVTNVRKAIEGNGRLNN